MRVLRHPETSYPERWSQSVAKYNRRACNYATFGKHPRIDAAPTGMEGLVDSPEVPTDEPRAVPIP